MDWTEQIFAYCERGLDAGFWAEPLNAVSNAAFLLAAGLALAQWRRGAQPGRRAELALIGLVGVIGIGSFLFHTLATRWAVVADTAPIGMFMLAYLAFAIRRFAGAAWRWTAALLVVFIAALWAAGSVRCGTGRCLNGSFGYIPALLALGLLAAWLGWRGHAAARALGIGTGLFALSLTARTLDRTLCTETGALGLHFIWHLANATLLYILLDAALRHGGRQAR